MPKIKGKWLLKDGLAIGLISLMATPAFSGPLLTDEGGPCVCIFMMIIIAAILILQILPATILFLCLSGIIIVHLYKMHKDKNTITKSSSD